MRRNSIKTSYIHTVVALCAQNTPLTSIILHYIYMNKSFISICLVTFHMLSFLRIFFKVPSQLIPCLYSLFHFYRMYAIICSIRMCFSIFHNFITNNFISFNVKQKLLLLTTCFLKRMKLNRLCFYLFQQWVNCNNN